MKFFSYTFLSCFLLNSFFYSSSASSFETLDKRSKESLSTAVIVIKNNQKIFEYRKGQHKLLNIMSITKSILSLAISILIDQKKLDLSDPVHKFFPEWNKHLKKDVTIYHLLTHTSGLDTNQTIEKLIQSKDFLKSALNAELTHTPGAKFFYNNMATNLLPTIIFKASGQAADKFIETHIFNKIGITHYFWEKDQAGNFKGTTGIHLFPNDLIKIGLLILNKGTWQEKNIISKEFVENLSIPCQPHNKEASFLWWIDGVITNLPLGIEATGYLGQRLIIIPDKNLVGLRMIKEEKSQDIKNVDTFSDFYEILAKL